MDGGLVRPDTWAYLNRRALAVPRFEEPTEFRHTCMSKYADARNPPLRSLRRRVRARRSDRYCATGGVGRALAAGLIEQPSPAGAQVSGDEP